MTEIVRIEVAEGRRGLGRRTEDRLGAFELVRRLDLLLLAGVVASVAYGLVVIGGITKLSPGGSAAPRQGVYAVVGIVVMCVAVFVNPAIYRRLAGIFYFGLLGVMLFVLATGAVTRGSKRWITAGGFTFQPSEFGKVVLALCLAAYVSDRVRRTSDLSLALRTIVLAAGPILLVFVQPDFGTALVYAAILAAVLFVSGIRWPQLTAIAAVAILLATAVLWILPAAGVNVLKPYQAARLTGFTHPGSDPSSATYQITQSITTVGAGGLRGRGIAGATQTSLGYLPADSTDFAFASLSEQRGFFGASILILLYLLIVWRGLRIVASASDLFSAIVAAAISFGFLFEVYVNVGMTIGVAPITGITLPFVSVGGSSMISNLAAMGILQAIHARRRRR